MMESENYEKKIVLVSQKVNSDEAERVHLQNFVLTGCAHEAMSMTEYSYF